MTALRVGSLILLALTASVDVLAHGARYGHDHDHHPSHTITARADATTSSITPLISHSYTYPGNDIPYQVDPNPTGRGPQFGYNICNSTTEGSNSDCQTAFDNNIADFCLWGPPDVNSTIGDEEARVVAWCSSPGHGSRIMPPGTITGIQVLKAPAYLLFAGTIVQSNINIQADDEGGELDPRGADLRGNPLGGLVISNGVPTSNTDNSTYQVVTNWSNFMGSDVFCMKLCDNTVSDSFQYCNNIFDETGCSFVAPASYEEGVFEVCDSDNQDPVGSVYTGSDGKTTTYSQPEVVVTLPSIRTPSSSNCVTYSSADLYASASSWYASNGGGSSVTGTTTATGTTTGATSKATSGTTSKASSGSGSSTSAKSTSTSSSGAMLSAPVGGNSGLVPFVALAMSVLAGAAALVVAL
ncbi:hypothetical protein DL93DRAFT_2080433 [Clavulina sp. PMI_390]|nr:hypothetical protein DL93DRAFT_2080433 [Clavulina sp. PMI_390]